MQLTKAYRAESISAQFAFLHILGLVGTQRREYTDAGHTRGSLPNHNMIHFGYDSKGKHTNRSAGCAVYYRSPFKEKHIHSISAPKKVAGLRGRAGAVTFLCRDVRVKIILAYFQPQP